jgi:hypothetical protein
MWAIEISTGRVGDVKGEQYLPNLAKEFLSKGSFIINR